MGDVFWDCFAEIGSLGFQGLFWAVEFGVWQESLDKIARVLPARESCQRFPQIRYRKEYLGFYINIRVLLLWKLPFHCFVIPGRSFWLGVARTTWRFMSS